MQDTSLCSLPKFCAEQLSCNKPNYDDFAGQGKILCQGFSATITSSLRVRFFVGVRQDSVSPLAMAADSVARLRLLPKNSLTMASRSLQAAPSYGLD